MIESCCGDSYNIKRLIFKKYRHIWKVLYTCVCNVLYHVVHVHYFFIEIMYIMIKCNIQKIMRISIRNILSIIILPICCVLRIKFVLNLYQTRERIRVYANDKNIIVV